jgi:putative DNA-invertase from lambdoid prophage Rac
MKVCIYARVSTDDQNVAQQVANLKEWCRNRDYTVIKVVADLESGTTPLRERKRFRKMLDVNEGWQAVVVYNLDRLTRNWEDVVYIEQYFRDNWDACRLISMQDTIDLSNASGRMMFRIKMAVCCYMPEDMREKQIVGILRAKAEGKYLGGKKGRTWK